MKKVILGLLALTIISCSKEKEAGFTLNGSVKNIADNTVLIMSKDNTDIDSTQIVDGKFTFKGSLKDPEKVYLAVKNSRNYTALWLENSEISLVSEDGVLRNAVITGSKNQTEEELLDTKLTPYDNLQDEIDTYAYENQKNLSKKQMDSLRVAYANAEQGYFDVIVDHVEENPGSFVGLYLIDFYKTSFLNRKDVQKAYDFLSEESKSHPMGQNIAKFLANKEINLGDSYVDITLKNPKDEDIALSKNLGDYTLVEFWASNCGPCRITNPKLVKVYEKYKSKGFQVYGVSFDTEKEKWLKAMKKDGLTWTNVVDLTGQDGDVGLQYGISGLPMNFLLDKNGKVIAKKISVTDLEATLSKALN